MNTVMEELIGCSVIIFIVIGFMYFLTEIV
jgi:hypothetical protein